MKKIFNFISLVAIGFLLFPSLSYALDTDNEQIAYITADEGEHLQKSRQSTLLGSVKAEQGTTKVAADRAIIHSDKDGEIEKIIAFGNPAKYQTLTEEGGDTLYATSQIIEYYPKTGIAILIDDAVVTQGKNIIKGPYLTYDMANGKLASKPKNNQRTTLIIHPKKKTT